MAPRAYYLRPALKPDQCIVEDCTMVPFRWSCLCNCHFMRWYLHGSFERLPSRQRQAA